MLYKLKQDPLTKQFQKLDTLFKKYNIETLIKPKTLTADVFMYAKNQERRLEGIENYFERKALNEKFLTLDRYFYNIIIYT